jgi:hypothetical protein
MCVRDSGLTERPGKILLIKLWVAPRAGKAADIGKRLDLILAKNREELLDRAGRVAEGPELA